MQRPCTTHFPNQLANKLRNTALKDAACCCMALVVACLLVAPRVLGAPQGPAAREARASLRSAPRLEARPCPPDPPAPSTPVGPGVLTCGWARRLAARPGPATAHRHRSQALRCPSCRWRWGFCTTWSRQGACRRRVRPSCSAIPPDWRQRGRDMRRCARQSADSLGKRRRKSDTLRQWVCTLADSVSIAGQVLWSGVIVLCPSEWVMR